MANHVVAAETNRRLKQQNRLRENVIDELQVRRTLIKILQKRLALIMTLPALKVFKQNAHKHQRTEIRTKNIVKVKLRETPKKILVYDKDNSKKGKTLTRTEILMKDLSVKKKEQRQIEPRERAPEKENLPEISREMEQKITEYLKNPAIIEIKTPSLEIRKQPDLVIIFDNRENREHDIPVENKNKIDQVIKGTINRIGQKEEINVRVDYPVAELVIEKYMAEKDINTVSHGEHVFVMSNDGESGLQITSSDTKQELSREERNEAVADFIVDYRDEISHLPKRTFDFSFRDECRIATYEMRMDSSSGEHDHSQVHEDVMVR